MRRRALWRLALGHGSLLGLTACGIPLLPDPPKLYTLTPKSTFAPDLPAVDWQLLVEEPVAAAGLDTVRIPLSQTPTTLDYYAAVAWTDRAPSMVQTLLVESFENTGRIISVGRDTVGLRADYVLKTELREFQAVTWGGDPPPQPQPRQFQTGGRADDPPTRVQVRLNAKLVRFPEREIVAGQSFEFIEPAPEPGFTGVIAAFDVALGSAIRRVVEWTLRAGAEDMAERV